MEMRGMALIAVVTASTLALPVTAAWSETATFQDRTQVSRSSTDVKWVEVTNDKAHNDFKVKVRVDKIRTDSALTVYVDRNLENRGPELRMVAVPYSEWLLFRVNRWGQRGQVIDTCGRVRLTSVHRATWSATRTCLNLDRAVRVGVKMVDPKGRVDWAPRSQAFFGRVAAS